MSEPNAGINTLKSCGSETEGYEHRCSKRSKRSL